MESSISFFKMQIVTHFKLFSCPPTCVEIRSSYSRIPPTPTGKVCLALGSEDTRISNKAPFPP